MEAWETALLAQLKKNALRLGDGDTKQVRRWRARLRAKGFAFGQQVFFFKNLHHRKRCCTRHGVTAISAAQATRSGRVHHFCTPDHAGQRHAASR